MTLPTVDRFAWMKHAACLGVDPDLFFPGSGGSGTNKAKRVCGRCPVRAECLEYAVSLVPTPAGVWGGETISRRKKMQRAHSRSAQ